MRIVFFGTPEFAVATAEEIRTCGKHEIVAAVTAPDKPAGRGLHLRASAVKEWALEHSVPVYQPSSLREAAFIEQLSVLHADCFVVVAFRMLPKSVWSLPPLGTFNVHASLLPDFRGAAPIHWAVYHGLPETGVTTFLLDDKIDTGALLLQEKTEVGKDETTGELYLRLQKIGSKLAVQTLDGLVAQSVKPTPQGNDSAWRAPKITREHQFLPLDLPALNWYNAYRSMTPFPGFLARINLEQVIEFKILKCNYIDKEFNINPRHRIEGNRWWIEGARGALELESIQWPGKRPMSVVEFLRGAPLQGYYEIV
jgi:methionyl-tRNA formyltransferase